MPTQLTLADRHNVSPLLTVWTQPRQTAEHVENSTSWLVVSLFATLSGLSTMLYLARAGAAFDKVNHSIALAIIAVGGALLGLVRVYFGAVCVRWVAHRLGGTGTYRSTCVALAWGSVPEAFALLVGLLAFAVTGADKVLPFLGVWSVVATSNGLSQLQRISGARALFAFAIGVSVAVSVWLLLILGITSAGAV